MVGAVDWIEVTMSLQGLKWAQQLQAIAQNGLTYSQNFYDIERFEQLQKIAAEMMANYTQLEPSEVLVQFREQMGYATPKVDVRGVVFQADKLLLVKEREDNAWTLPGGWADVGDSPSEAVVREVYEESGYQTQVVKLLALYDRNHPRHNHPPHPNHIYKLFFQCELIGGASADSFETGEATFFGESEIPDLSLTRVVPSQITQLFQYYRNPALPTDFD